MKKLDLNIDIEIDEKEEASKVSLAIMWIGVMLERSLNKPDPKTNRPTAQVGMEQQRKYYKVMTSLEGHKDGIVEMEDDVFAFLDRKYHQAEMPIQKGVTKALVSLSDAINKAKV